MKQMNKWFWAFVGVAVALVAAIIVAIVLGVNGAKGPDDTPLEEGAESGVYYYDADDGEYTVHLHSGNQFTLNDGVAKVGEYTVSGNTVSFDFAKDSNGSATATLENGVLTLTYNGEEIRFLKKVNYTVTFDSNGGSAVDSASVVNGRPVKAPADPERDGHVFIGWYTDKNATTPYVFSSSSVTANTTLYAGWAAKTAGREYTIDFEGAAVDAMTTVGGKLYNVPTPSKDGYTFGGWWISMYEDGEKLSYKYEADTTFNANTTLYAVWVSTTGDKLNAPLVTVNDAGISWAQVNGAATYAVKITAPDGTVVFNENVNATSKNFDFAVAGGYVVEVSAVSTNTANSSDATVRYYNAKALDRVSVFEVVEPSVLVFNSVPGAEKYYVTVKCGNSKHTHTYYNNGKSTVFNFANCEMKEGGIEFTVTAVANGYASSVSEVFTHERKLDKVTDLNVNAADELLVWSPVADAMYYSVKITCPSHGTHTELVTASEYSLKCCAAGEISVSVTPVTDGYLSSASEYTYTKKTLAAPAGVEVVGTVISWNQVAGATGYTVMVGSKTFSTTELVFDLADADVSFTIDDVVSICVKAETADNASVYSDAVTANYLTLVGEPVYANGVLSWAPVIGDGYYEVKINGASAITVQDATSLAVALTKSGVNTFEVRFVGEVNTAWISTEVYAYKITFDSRQGSGASAIYVAAGDLLNLPTDVTRTGYSFGGWYNTPNAAATNGKLCDEKFFSGSDDVVLYAEWNPNQYKITYEVDSDVSGVVNGSSADVFYGQNFTLTPVTSDIGAFLGWFSGPGGSGYQLTDSTGKSVVKHLVADDVKAYPFFETGALEYIAREDGTWSVRQGPGISRISDLIIPETYKGIPVTAILENAFEYCNNIITISIPDTVTLIGTGALTSCYDLEAINIRKIEGNHEAKYSSYDGALIREDMGTVYLEMFPKGKKGEYTIPNTVDSIRNKAFQYSYYLEKLIISESVTYIAEQAFYRCPMLTEIEFLGGGDKALTIADEAFVNTTVLKKITFPARLENITLSTLDACARLEQINVEADGTLYGSVDGMLTNADLDTILYCPVVRRGELVIPAGVTAIGEGAFAGRTGITKVIISNKVTDIAKNAFAGCTGITSVEFVGGRNVDLYVGEGAFSGCTGINTIDIGGGTTLDEGDVVLGKSAFAGCTQLLNLNVSNTASVTEIGESAFEGCSRLSTLVIPATTATIGNSAFKGCTNMSTVAFAENGVAIEFGSSVFAGCQQLRSIHLPATVETFDGSVFDGCDNISEIVVDSDNPALVAEDGVLYNKSKTEVMYYPRAKEVDFSALPTTLTKIGAAAFQNNPKISTVEIPANITAIGDKAFDGCINLTNVSFAGTNEITFGDYAFSNCPELATITLPEATTAIGAYTFYKSGLTEFTLPEAVTSIGAFAFANTKLESFEISGAVQTVGEGAFSNCKSLASVTVAAGADKLALGTASDEVGVFEGDYALLTVVLDKRIQSVGVRAFYDLYKLTTMTIPADSALETIGAYAFYYNGFSEINLPEGLVSIGESAFRDVKNMSSITIPSTVTDIGVYAFSGTKLESVTFTPGSEPLTINDYAFSKNTTIKTIDLPARLVKIYNNVSVGSGIPMTSFYTVFDGCTALTDIFVDDACEYFSDVSGVFYSNDAEGNPATLIFCPRGKTEDVTVPATVTLVSNAAFYKTKVANVIFESIADWNGVGTLSIGTVDVVKNGDEPYAVFGGNSNLQKVVFPVQLASMGAYTFNKIDTAAGVTIEFDKNSVPVSLGERCFYQNKGIITLDLPAVSKISKNAFYSNSNMTSVSFGSGSTATSIGESVFSNSSKLTEVLNIPATVKTVQFGAFAACSRLATITWEADSQLTTIESYAFQSTGITEFVFPETVENIGSNVFGWCNSLTTVTLSSRLASTVSADGGAIFSNASAISKVIVPETNTKLVEIGGAIYSADKTVLMFVPPKMDITGFKILDTVTTIEDFALYNFKGTSLELPSGLVKIGSNALGYAAMTSLVIPASVTTIGSYAFTNMMSLTSVIFEEYSELVEIGNDAFYYCNMLTTIAIPDTVTRLGYQAFRYCLALESVELPTGITTIEYGMFDNCKALRFVELHEGIEVIEEGVFNMCMSIEEIVIPSTVRDIQFEWTGVFTNCYELESVRFADGSKLEAIGANTFTNCTSLESIVLPESLTTLPAGLFVDCSAMKSVTILGDVQTIPAGLFSGMSELTTVVLPETVTVIGDGAFEGCASLVDVTIPEGIEEIGEAAFKGCASLESVTIGESIELIGDYAFDGCSSLANVEFADGCNLEYLGNDPTAESAIFRGTTALKSIALPETVKTLGANAFENSGLESVALPASLTAIGNSAFKGCNSLVSVSVPETVKSIGDFAFADCAELADVAIAFGVESIGSGSFMNCVNLVSINVPATVNSIAGNPFINCPNLSEFDFDTNSEDFVFEDGALFDADKFTLIYYLPSNTAETYEAPSTVREFAAGAFYGSQLKSFTIPDSVRVIPDMLFMDSKLLETVVIYKSVTTIGNQAFQGCSELTEVTIHENIDSIGEYAFAGCSSLATVSFNDRSTAYSIGAHAFEGCTSLSAIELPVGLEALTPYMFANTGLTSFVLPESVTDVNIEGVFAYNTKLASFTFHDSVEPTLGERFFYNSTGLVSVDLGSIENLGTIIYDGYDYNADGIFDYISGLLPNNSEAFYGCTSLESIDLTNVHYLGHYAFYGCESLEEVTFGEYLSVVGDYAFAGSGIKVADMRSVYTAWGFDEYYNNIMLGKCLFENCVNLEAVYFPGGPDADWTCVVSVLHDGLFAGCTSLQLVEIYNFYDFGLNEAPFRGLPATATVVFHEYDVETYLDYFSAVYDYDIGDYVDNYNWVDMSSGIIMDAYGSVILPDRTVLFPEAEINDDGSIEFANGTVINADRSVDFAEGETELPEGVSIQGDVVYIGEDTTVDANGTITIGERIVDEYDIVFILEDGSVLIKPVYTAA